MRKELSPKAKALLAAADWLEEHEWGQDVAYFIRDGQYNVVGACAVGALRIAAMGHDGPDSYVQVYNLMQDEYALGNLVLFNDQPGRTKEEVVAHLRELALTA